MTDSKKDVERRPVPGRENTVSQSVMRWLIRLRVTPNTISILSMIFAIGAGICMAATAYSQGIAVRVLWFAASALILLRMWANLLDGMVAFASGQRSPLGDVLNEVPDRISDTVILVGAGFAAGSSAHLGYIAALVAMFVAYLRSFGNFLGVEHLFIGPFSKPYRMMVLTVTGLYLALTPAGWQPVHIFSGWGLPAFALAIIILGSAWTAIRRLARIIDVVTNRPGH